MGITRLITPHTGYMATPRLPQTMESPTETQTAKMAEEYAQWAITRGLVKDVPEIGVTHAPLTLTPCSFPRGPFEKVWNLQTAMNRLLYASGADGDLLHAVLDPVAASDAFVAGQLNILDAVGGVPGGASGFSVGIWRTDYLLHQVGEDDPMGILQVENNAISVAYAALSSIVCSLHEYALTSGMLSPLPGTALHSPPNEALKNLVFTLSSAHKLYAPEGEDAVVVIVVQEGELNQYDQRWIQYLLFESFGIRAVRASHNTLIDGLDVDQDSSVARYGEGEGEKDVVSVFYFRAGYTPEDYPTDAHWEVRTLIEASSSIKIPDISAQLAGSKAVQRALTDRDILSRYLDQDVIDDALSVFAGMYALPADDADADAIIAKAIANPDNYVLKPQREGGGNNLYRQEMADALASMPRAELEAYILMDRIVPPQVSALVMRNKNVQVVDAVSELGVFGFFIYDVETQKEVYNAPGGYLLRTKPSNLDEGGVSAGVSYLDSLVLYDQGVVGVKRGGDDDPASSSSSSSKRQKPLSQ